MRMVDVFAKLDFLFGTHSIRDKGEIRIYSPRANEDGTFYCEVEFDGVEKFNRSITGDDEIHALECAVVYVNGIRNNSKNPEFFWSNGDSMFVEQVG
ncbi:DUF6968 family protein [Erythrobacter sp. GH1-10]|uniref:DUF6968 family protein n=1 Tax=Erythrobacter sp. GH1-10 TaxID=3349334 RepID=UPI00387823C2